MSPLIQFARNVSAANMLSPAAHAFETSDEASVSFAAHLNQAVESSPRPVTRPEATPVPQERQASDLTARAQRPPVTTTHSSAPQTKQNQSVSSKAKNSDPSPVQKDEQHQSINPRKSDSRSSSDSRSPDRRKSGEEDAQANSECPSVGALAKSDASQTGAPAATQSGEATATATDASMPAALLALLQAQSAAQPVTGQLDAASASELNPSEADSSPASSVSAVPFSFYGQLSFGNSAAYTFSQAGVQSSPQSATGSSSVDGVTSGDAANTTSGDPNTQPSSAGQASTASANAQTGSSASSGDSSNAASQTSSVNKAGEPAVAATIATPTQARQADAAITGAAHPVPSTSEQQASPSKPGSTHKSLQSETAESANPFKNLKLDVSHGQAGKPVLESGSASADKTKEPVAAELQQVLASATVVVHHVSSPAVSRHAGATDAQSQASLSDAGTAAPSTAQTSASGSADGSEGDSAGDDSTAQLSSASQGPNTFKSSGSAVEFLPSAAFNNDAVSGVAAQAVHAVAAGTLQSNTAFDNTASQAPANAPQTFNSAAQEKAFAAWQSVSAQVGRVVNTATLGAVQNGTEMRVQLRTDAFGAMDIRATFEGGKVGAAIGVESAEAHSALVSQLSALQESLNERQVQLDQISVVSSYGQSGTEFGAGSGKQNSDSTPSGGSPQQPWGSEQVSEPASASVTEAWQPATSRGRLSVRA